MTSSRTKIRNVFLYSTNKGEDQVICQELLAHLGHFEKLYGVSILSNNGIRPGKVREEEVRRLLNAADLVLLLISADFLNDDRCYKEMQNVLKLEKEGRTNVIRIIIRPIDKLYAKTLNHVLPTNAVPITSWQNRDEAYADISTNIHEFIQGLRTSIWTSLWEPQRKLVQVDYTPYKVKAYKRDIATSNKAIRINPKDGAAYSKKGRALCQLGRFKKAIPVLEKAILLNPKDTNAYINKAVAFYELKHFEKAIPDLEKAIRLNPYNSFTPFIKGAALYKLERFEEAIPDLKKALDLDPSLDKAYLLKGQSLRKLERFEEAIPDLKKALDLNPDNYAAIRNNRDVSLWYDDDTQSRYSFLIILGVVTLGGVGYGLFYSFIYPKKTLSYLFSQNTHTDPPKSSPTVQDISSSEKASALIQQYYDAINKQDYPTAYSMWQDNVTGKGLSYDQFVAGYANTLHDDITFDNIVPQDNTTVSVTITIHATERNGTGTYSAHYIVGAFGDTWRIISGDVEKIALHSTFYKG